MEDESTGRDFWMILGVSLGMVFTIIAALLMIVILFSLNLGGGAEVEEGDVIIIEDEAPAAEDNAIEVTEEAEETEIPHAEVTEAPAAEETTPEAEATEGTTEEDLTPTPSPTKEEF